MLQGLPPHAKASGWPTASTGRTFVDTTADGALRMPAVGVFVLAVTCIAGPYCIAEIVKALKTTAAVPTEPPSPKSVPHVDVAYVYEFAKENVFAVLIDVAAVVRPHT
jgi:hypothetical protein